MPAWRRPDASRKITEKRVTFRLKPDLVARVKVIRELHGITMTAFVVEALIRLIEEEEEAALREELHPMDREPVQDETKPEEAVEAPF